MCVLLALAFSVFYPWQLGEYVFKLEDAFQLCYRVPGFYSNHLGKAAPGSGDGKLAVCLVAPRAQLHPRRRDRSRTARLLLDVEVDICMNPDIRDRDDA